MWKRILLVAFGLGLGFLVVPVVVTQLLPPKARSLIGVELREVRYQDVRFYNAEQDLNLAGMLFLPEGEGPFPGVVIVHGAGTSQRNNTWYLRLVSYLQNHGVVVLLPDKRGSEFSEGNWRTASFQDLATDSLAAVSFLRNYYPQEISSIGVLGASQGGQVVPIVATQSDDIVFAINVVGSAVPFYDALVYEENHNLKQMGFLPGFSNFIAHLSSFYIRKIAQKDFWDVIGNYDPLPYWAKVDIPAMVLYGAQDTNTPSQKSADRLNGLGNPNLRVVIFEGSGHPLEDPVGTGNSSFREDALSMIQQFIIEAVSNR